MAEGRKPTADEQRRYLWRGKARESAKEDVSKWFEIDLDALYRVFGAWLRMRLEDAYERGFVDGAKFEHTRNRHDDKGSYRD